MNAIKLLLLTFFLLNSDFIIAQYNWTKYEGNPVLSGGGDGSWDNHVFEPMVLFNPDSSRFEMYYNGSYGPGTPAWRPFRIGLAYSQDGINWTQYPGNPILVPIPGTWDEGTVERPWVIRENGQYKMWYYGYATSIANFQIGYATSPDGINWTKHTEPVLSPGTAEWELGGVYAPSVLANGSGYTMYYAGTDINTTHDQIGRAFSADGIEWIKDTINNPLLQIGASDQWDANYVSTPSVLDLNDKLFLWYMGAPVSSYNGKGIGLAFSTDGGVTWTKGASNPVIVPGPKNWDYDYIEFPYVILISDTLYMWYHGSKEPQSTNLWRIGLAKSPITDPPVGVQDKMALPTQFALHQNYPNPFNPSTKIKYSIPQSLKVTIKVFDVLGKEVAVLVNEEKPRGTYEINWIAENIPSGVYFYQIRAGSFVKTNKMILMK